ncbi:MAG: hypothetical protein Kow0025_14150 [Thermodesulfovibrionales bacterium]
MDYCDGIRDGFKCFRCERLCARDCPLEGDDALEKLRRWLRTADGRKADTKRVKEA